MSDLTRAFETVIVTEDGRDQNAADLPLEAPLRMEVNGVHLATLMRLPGNDRELALGFWLTEGLITGRDDIVTMEHCPDDPNLLRLRLTGDVPDAPPMAIGTACGGILGREMPEALSLQGPVVAAEVLMSLRGLLQQNQPIRERAGGVHAAAILAPDGRLVVAHEDIGRHNALDKVIGHCVLRGDTLADKIVLLTGRHTAEMVTPSSLGVELADRLGVTLVARLRRDRFEVFSHPERIA